MITYDFLLEGEFAVIKFSGNIEKKTLTSFLEYIFQKKKRRNFRKL